MMLEYAALVIMIILALLGVLVALKLGALPGEIAAKRGHPQEDAIRVCGWIGLLTMGLFWPVALIWAYTVKSQNPIGDRDAESDGDEENQTSSSVAGEEEKLDTKSND